MHWCLATTGAGRGGKGERLGMCVVRACGLRSARRAIVGSVGRGMRPQRRHPGGLVARSSRGTVGRRTRKSRDRHARAASHGVWDHDAGEFTISWAAQLHRHRLPPLGQALLRHFGAARSKREHAERWEEPGKSGRYLEGVVKFHSPHLWGEREQNCIWDS